MATGRAEAYSDPDPFRKGVRAMSGYAFGPLYLDPDERLLLREGAPVSLTPKAFDLLLHLVRRHGHLVTKQELMEALWPDTFVEEANVTYTVSALRKALGDGQDGEHYIQTVPTRGYRFVASVTEPPGADGEASSVEAHVPTPDVRRPLMRRPAMALLAILLLLAVVAGAWPSLEGVGLRRGRGRYRHV